MKVLVTGSAGFIGFYLTNKLLANGYEVIGIDNINDYYDVNLKLARLKEAGIQITPKYGVQLQSSKFSNYTFIKVDISDRDTMKRLFEDYKFDIVCNLAAQAGVRYSIENPNTYIDSNIVGFANILEGCRHNQVKHLIYASSSSVYGMNEKIPFSISDNVDFPVSLYAATKKSNELMAHAYSHLYQLPTTGLRFFTVYGPWGRPDMAYFLFANAIQKGEAIKVFNNGDMSRDFTYIDDVVEGILKVVENSPPYCKGEKSNKIEDTKVNELYRVFNIGKNQPVNLLEFIKFIEYYLGKSAKKQFLPMQPGDVYITYSDSSELMELFGYHPEVGIDEGIGLFVDWFIDYKTNIKSVMGSGEK